MFQQRLDELVAQTGADFAIFCDFEGESIALSSRKLDEFNVRLIGAQLGIWTTQLERVHRDLGMGERAQIVCELPSSYLLVEALRQSYYLVLRLPRSSLVGPARFRLRAVGEKFSAEL
jgi:hypothetical protein